MKIKVSLAKSIEMEVPENNVPLLKKILDIHAKGGSASWRDYWDARDIVASTLGIPFDDDDEEFKKDSDETIIGVYDLDGNPIIEL